MGTKNWFNQEQVDEIVAYLHQQTRQEMFYRRHLLFKDIDNAIWSKHLQLLRRIPKKELQEVV